MVTFVHLFLIYAAVSSVSRILPYAALEQCPAVDAYYSETGSITGYNRD